MMRRVLLCVAFCLPLIAAGSAAAEKRVALVIGNSAYQHAGKLANPVNDAGDVAKILAGFGFEVIIGIDLERRGFDEKVRAYSRALQDADASVLFYAGHGLQVAGRNYLIPVDAALESERDLDFEAVPLDFVLKQMEIGREGKTNVVFLDACRNNPLSRNLARSMGTRAASIGQGLAEVQTGVGTFIAYSTQPGNVALDGDGRNSPFAAALAKRVLEPGHNLTSIMIDVRKDVLAATGGAQVPWDHSALTTDFFFQQAEKGSSGRSAQDTDAVRARLRLIEEELLKASDPKRTANIVLLAQLKERVHRLNEAMREDQQRIFDTYRTQKPGSETSLEVGRIQMQMVRRGEEKKKVSQQITELENQLGLPASATEETGKK